MLALLRANATRCATPNLQENCLICFFVNCSLKVTYTKNDNRFKNSVQHRWPQTSTFTPPPGGDVGLCQTSFDVTNNENVSIQSILKETFNMQSFNESNA